MRASGSPAKRLYFADSFVARGATSALAKQAEAQSVLIKLAAPLQAVVSAAATYQALDKEILAINAQLRGADRNELCVRSPLHGVTIGDESLPRAFDFLQEGRLMMPGEAGPNLLEIAARLKNAQASK